jgi:hypothetical protein
MPAETLGNQLMLLERSEDTVVKRPVEATQVT